MATKLVDNKNTTMQTQDEAGTVRQLDRKQSSIKQKQASHHDSWFLAIKHASQIVHNFSHVIVRNFGTPSSSNAFSTINQHHWYDRNVPLRLNSQVIVSQMTQQWLILKIEHMSCQCTETPNNGL